MSNYVTSCEQFAREAGEVLLQWRGQITVREKGRADLVTEADLAAQNVIARRIAAEFPEHRFVGEEETARLGASTQTPASEQQENSGDYCWYVDPLDGTTNYVHDLPGWCVSVALAERGRVIAGCVFDPLRDACYTAARGEGAFGNGQRLSASQNPLLRDALVAVSFPASVQRNSPEIGQFLDLLPQVRAFRRLGSAALNLCYVAAGSLDAYWARHVYPWDVAAGALFVEEAGGVVTNMSGDPFVLDSPNIAAAGNPDLHRTFVQRLGHANR